MARMFEGSKVNVIVAPSPQGGKERRLRRLRRRLAYMNLLLRSSVRKMDLSSIRFWGTRFFNGEQLSKEKAEKLLKIIGGSAYIEDIGDRINIIVSSQNVVSRVAERKGEISSLLGKNIMVVNVSQLKGLVVGLLDKNLECIGVALIEELKPEENILRLKTNVNVENVRFIVPGRIKILEDGSEVQYRYPLID